VGKGRDYEDGISQAVGGKRGKDVVRAGFSEPFRVKEGKDGESGVARCVPGEEGEDNEGGTSTRARDHMRLYPGGAMATQPVFPRPHGLTPAYPDAPTGARKL